MAGQTPPESLFGALFALLLRMTSTHRIPLRLLLLDLLPVLREFSFPPVPIYPGPEFPSCKVIMSCEDLNRVSAVPFIYSSPGSPANAETTRTGITSRKRDGPAPRGMECIDASLTPPFSFSFYNESVGAGGIIDRSVAEGTQRELLCATNDRHCSVQLLVCRAHAFATSRTG